MEGKMKVSFTREQKKNILEILLSTGGEFAEVFMEDTVSETIEMYSGKITNVDSSTVSGAAVRIIKDDIEVNTSVSDYSYENLIKVATELSKSFEGEVTTKVEEFKDIDKALYYKMMANGTEHIACCVIQGVNEPLAFLFITFDKKTDLHNCDEIHSIINDCSLQLSLLMELKKTQ